MRSVGASEQDASVPGRQSPPGDDLRWRQVFPGEERELAMVRRWLAALLPACAARDDVVLVATELGTNAVQHTASGRGGRFSVEVTWSGPVVRVAVFDSGAPDGPRLIADPDAESGRGLLVVRGLSSRTGVCGDERGRVVWADVPWGGAGTKRRGQRLRQRRLRQRWQAT